MNNSFDLEKTSIKIRSWLAGKLQSYDLVVSDFSMPGHGGMSHDTILCRARWSDKGVQQERGLVFRLAPVEGHIRPEYDLEVEARIMRVLGDCTRIPVPQVLWFEADTRSLGCVFYVMALVEGRVPSDNPSFVMEGWLYDADAPQQAIAQKETIRMMADLHTLDWCKLGFGFVGQHKYGAVGLDQEFGYWKNYLNWATRETPLPKLTRAFEYCLENRPVEDGPVCLNWGDARYGNIIFNDKFEIAAVLDWELAVLGPAELDLGWIIFLHETALMWLDDLPGFMNREAIIEYYQQHAGREVKNIEFYEAWSGFKASLINARIIERDFHRGVQADLSQQEAHPVVMSLARLIPNFDA